MKTAIALIAALLRAIVWGGLGALITLLAALIPGVWLVWLLVRRRR